jgi:hypothetical protein
MAGLFFGYSQRRKALACRLRAHPFGKLCSGPWGKRKKTPLCMLDKGRNMRYDEVVMFAIVLVEMPCGKGS